MDEMEGERGQKWLGEVVLLRNADRMVHLTNFTPIVWVERYAKGSG